MEYKQKILDIIQSSPLPVEDKREWEAFVDFSSEISLESIAILLETFPGELDWITGILKRKKEAFAVLKSDKDRGEKMLQNIYQEEREKTEKWNNK